MQISPENLDALHIANPDSNRKILALQVYYSYYVLTEIASLSEWFLTELSNKTNQWQLAITTHQEPADIRRSRQSCQQLYQVGRVMGLFYVDMPQSPEELESLIEKMILTIGAKGTLIEEAKQAFTQTAAQLKQVEESEDQSVSIKEIIAQTFFFLTKDDDGKIKAEKTAVRKVGELVATYTHYVKTLNKAQGATLADGTVLDVQFVQNRLEKFLAPYLH